MNPRSRADAEEGNPISPVLSLLRNAIAESGWKHDALAVAMRLPNAAYLSRMLAGEKPWTLRHLRALPDDIEAIFVRLWAEAFGFVVIRPLAGDDAVKSFAAGLLGMFASQFPARASQMAKASLESEPVPQRRTA